MKRAPCIVSTTDVAEEEGGYPGSDEITGHGRPIGAAAGLVKIGLHVERVEPGQRTSYPHAEESLEEFVYVRTTRCTPSDESRWRPGDGGTA